MREVASGGKGRLGDWTKGCERSGPLPHGHVAPVALVVLIPSFRRRLRLFGEEASRVPHPRIRWWSGHTLRQAAVTGVGGLRATGCCMCSVDYRPVGMTATCATPELFQDISTWACSLRVEGPRKEMTAGVYGVPSILAMCEQTHALLVSWLPAESVRMCYTRASRASDRGRLRAHCLLTAKGEQSMRPVRQMYCTAHTGGLA